MEALLELSKGDFKKQVTIQFDSIVEGFNNYQNNLITPTSTKDLVSCEKDIGGFIKALYNLNENRLVVDFYLSRLSDIEFKSLFDSLNNEDKNILEKIKNKEFKSNYFEVIDESIIDFLVRLCTRELFFITFYFEKYPLTLWGNYDFKFPMFYINEEDINIYLPLIEKYKLKII